MSDVVSAAVAALSDKLGDEGFDGSLKIEIADEGALIVDGGGARAGDEDADCTLKADAETFQGMMAGEVNPTSAFMTGKLAIEGDMGTAMKLAALLS